MNEQKNTIEKALLVKKIVDEHYEEGRQDRSMSHIFRTKVLKIYPMGYRTFWRLLRIAKKAEELKKD